MTIRNRHDEDREQVVAALELARSIVRQLIAAPTAFLDLCAAQGAVAQAVLDKLVAETALFALLARRCLGPHDAVWRLTREIAPLARTDTHRALLRLDPSAAAGMAMTHRCLEELGIADDEFGRLLADCAAAPAEADRPVFREMEQRWIGAIGAAAPPDCVDLLPGSVIARPHTGEQRDDSTAYALTHEIFYLTDFGRHRLPAGLPGDALTAAIDDALADQFGLNNLDLLAELAMVRAITGAAASPASVLADALIRESWSTYRFLPSPSFRIDRYADLDEISQATYLAMGIYHTTYVGALYLMTRMRLTPHSEAGFATPSDADGAVQVERWLPRLRGEAAPILARVLSGVPRDAEPVLVRAAAARASSLVDAAG